LKSVYRKLEFARVGIATGLVVVGDLIGSGAIFDGAAGAGINPGELWRYTSPYRGLEAIEEKDSDYFFERARETVEVLNALAAPDRLPVLIGQILAGAGRRAGGAKAPSLA
jgi:hypothetical protein